MEERNNGEGKVDDGEFVVVVAVELDVESVS